MDTCLITEQGKVVECLNMMHEITCIKEFGIKLHTFLKRGGVRIMVGRGQSIAIEYYDEPTEAQMIVIRKVLRADDYYTVVLAKQIIRKFRPIRGFKV